MEDTGKATVSRLMGILAGKTPIPDGVEIIAQDVVSHMDGFTFSGINTWANWLRYIRTRSRVAELDLQVDRLVANDDGTISAYGRWKALDRGTQIFSKEVWARYRVRNGKVIEIWTTRTNYVFMLGPIMRSRVGLMLIMLHVYFWGKATGRLDLLSLATQPVNP
jgi:hypothetical protein